MCCTQPLRDASCISVLDGWWGGEDERQLVYGTPVGRIDLDDFLGDKYRSRASFDIDRQHVRERHFERDVFTTKSKFDISFSQALQLCVNVLQKPNRVRFYKDGVLFSGVLEGDLCAGMKIFKVWVDINSLSAPIRTFYPATAL